jgi:hypothetical protein
LKQIEREPMVSVGLITGAETVSFELKGEFADASGALFSSGNYQTATACNRVEVVDESGRRYSAGYEIKLSPVAETASALISTGNKNKTCSFKVRSA